MPRDLIPSEVRDFSGEQMDNTPHQQMTDAEYEQFLIEALKIILIQDQKRRVTDTESAIKKDLMKALEMYGDPYGPAGQHQSIAFPEPIRGYARFVRQQKVTTVPDEVKAEAIARSKGLFERLFKPVPILDEGAVIVAREEGLLTDDEIAEIFPKKIVWAFVPEKKKP